MVTLSLVFGHADAKLVTSVTFLNLVLPSEQKWLGSLDVMLAFAIRVLEEIKAVRKDEAV